MQRKNAHLSKQLILVCQNPFENDDQSDLNQQQTKIKFPFTQNNKKLNQYRSLQKLNPRPIHHNQQKTINLKTVQCHEVYIYLIYKNSKIQLQFPNGTPLKSVVQSLFKKIIQFEITVMKLTIQQATQETQKVLGFTSQDTDIQFDYLLSISMQSNQNNSQNDSQYLKLKKSKFIKPFFKKQNIKGQINYKICKCLAIGGFSKVYLARSYLDGKFYAIKFIKKYLYDSNIKSPTKQKNAQQINVQHQKFQSLVNQIDISKQLNHPFLIKLAHAFQTQNLYGLTFQYCPGGQLFYLLKKRKIFSQNQARFYFLQILYGISYLHEHSIIYRDLKPQNILIDWAGNLKIVDFGLSKKINQLKNKQKSFSYCGSAEYMAPEMILRTGHSFSLDYYSLGALLYQLVTGLPPFYTKDQKTLQQSILFQQLSFPNQLGLSSQIKDLLTKLLQKQQRYRLGSLAGLKQILFHPWIGRINSKDILDKKVSCPYPPNLQDHNFDPNELGQDEAIFTKLVKRQLYDLQKVSTKPKRLVGIRSQDNSFYNDKRLVKLNQSLHRCTGLYKKTFYQYQNFGKLNSRFVELAKQSALQYYQVENNKLNIDHSQTKISLKHNSINKISSFSTHRGNKYILSFCQTQSKKQGQFVEYQTRKQKQNHSLDKIDQKQNDGRKDFTLPYFSVEKKPSPIIEQIQRIKRSNYKQKKTKFDQRLFNNLKNTYLSNSFKKKNININTQSTFRGTSNHETILKSGSITMLKKILPKKVVMGQNNENMNVLTKYNEQMKKMLYNNDRQFTPNNPDDNKIYANKKKILRGNKILLNQNLIKKNQIIK